MKQFVKGFVSDCDCFKYFSRKCLVLSCEKIKSGVFDGTQIKRILRNEHILSDAVKEAWNDFGVAVSDFQENRKSQIMKKWCKPC